MITQQELKTRLDYNESTGVFVWLKPGFNKGWLIGREAGSLDPEGYRIIKLSGRLYRAHHLAWLYVHGVMPTMLDHRNGVRGNNAISNLREVTHAGNSQNQRKAHVDSSHGFIGVDYNKGKNRYRARIQTGGRRVDLGGFRSADEAHAAYVAAKRSLHGTCTI